MERTSARGSIRRRTRAGLGRRRGPVLAPRERRRLLQLSVCMALFLAVFLGRGIFPERMEALRGELLEAIRADTDFQEVFSQVGRAVEAGAPAGEVLAGLWQEVFAPVEAGEPYLLPEEGGPLYEAERAFLSTGPGLGQALERRMGQLQREDQEESCSQEPAQAVAPLGLEETVAPVLAAVSSPFGWREHPIEGGEKFHNGVDLAAPYGDPIGAFADGTVDYIGESPAYGLYIQVAHESGVTSFYAHCSQLLVQPGQEVAAGETIALVGDTGEVTGAHLHFELRVDGALVDPLLYLPELAGE